LLTRPINSNTTQNWRENVFLIYARQPCYSLSSESYCLLSRSNALQDSMEEAWPRSTGTSREPRRKRHVQRLLLRHSTKG
jgi:hypothetical protein